VNFLLRQLAALLRYPVGCSSQTGGGITGGCGFSWIYPQPSYQSAQVAKYLASIDSSFGNFNASGRAYPDVSGIASNVPTIMALKQVIVGGTSASTPEVGGLISLINDQRLNNNLPPLGFLNPRLYAAAAQRSDLFVDVTSGSSRCGTDKCCSSGFTAISGWDSFTGFGNPLFPGWLASFGVAP
jgi:tripeptidyl-peptidase I